MKILLNVRINLTETGRIFIVWARPHRFLPGIEFHTGMGETLPMAIDNLSESLPDYFCIDNELSVRSDKFEYVFKRPFDILKSKSLRTFNIC